MEQIDQKKATQLVREASSRPWKKYATCKTGACANS
jgi:hypothetical protein